MKTTLALTALLSFKQRDGQIVRNVRITKQPKWFIIHPS